MTCNAGRQRGFITVACTGLLAAEARLSSRSVLRTRDYFYNPVGTRGPNKAVRCTIGRAWRGLSNCSCR
jgi:hypothetical protein